MNGKTKGLAGGVAVLLVLAAGVALMWRGGTPQPVDRQGGEGGAEKAPQVKTAKGSPKREVKAARPEKPKLELRSSDEDDDKRTPEERALAERIEKALDDEKLEDALACAKEALASRNVEIRQAMVDTLGWFGEKALPELTPFLADPDEDVRESALNEWSMAVSDIEDDAEKIGVVELAMNVLSEEDALEDISGEYIGVDEKLAVESLARIIEANGSQPGVEKAKETYEFVTGEEWVSGAAAAKWIEEEYEPPLNSAKR